MSKIFVYVEAHFDSPYPGIGSGLTEFGAVEYESRAWFHGKRYLYEMKLSNSPISSLYEADLTCASPWHEVFLEFERWLQEFEGRPVFISDNPAYDWQWINYHFWHELGRNPFGCSARRIGDFYAGVTKDWDNSVKWKALRVTKHNNNPVHDAMGNAEAFERIMQLCKKEKGEINDCA